MDGQKTTTSFAAVRIEWMPPTWDYPLINIGLGRFAETEGWKRPVFVINELNGADFRSAVNEVAQHVANRKTSAPWLSWSPGFDMFHKTGNPYEDEAVRRFYFVECASDILSYKGVKGLAACHDFSEDTWLTRSLSYAIDIIKRPSPAVPAFAHLRTEKDGDYVLPIGAQDYIVSRNGEIYHKPALAELMV